MAAFDLPGDLGDELLRRDRVRRASLEVARLVALAYLEHSDLPFGGVRADECLAKDLQEDGQKSAAWPRTEGDALHRGHDAVFGSIGTANHGHGSTRGGLVAAAHVQILSGDERNSA
jgi:hypothetical protein